MSHFLSLQEENYVEAISNAHKMWATASIGAL